jgi:hypothetical protein
MTAGGKTPASMIMTGILQIRQMAMMAYIRNDYYHSAWLFAQMAELLPMEAKKSDKNPHGLDIPTPPTMGKSDAMTPDVKVACRQWIEKHVLPINGQIPKYVYQYFERGRRMMQGY